MARACAGLLGDVLVGPDGLGDLPADGVHGIQRRHRVLEDHGDAGAADLVSSFSFRPRSSRPSKRIEPRTCGALGEEAHGGQGRHRLARARLADDAEDLAGGEGEVDAAHGVDHAVLRFGSRPRGRSTCRAGSATQALTRLFLGSNASRRPSPMRKIERMRMMRKTTGKTNSHHSVVAESWPWFDQEARATRWAAGRRARGRRGWTRR